MPPNKRKCKGKIGNVITVDCRQRRVWPCVPHEKLHAFRKKMTKNLKVAAKGQDMSELGLTAINVQVDKVGYSVGFWSRCPFP